MASKSVESMEMEVKPAAEKEREAAMEVEATPETQPERR